MKAQVYGFKEIKRNTRTFHRQPLFTSHSVETLDDVHEVITRESPLSFLLLRTSLVIFYIRQESNFKGRKEINSAAREDEAYISGCDFIIIQMLGKHK